MTATINLTKSNRAIGLLNEVAALIADEDCSLELHRIRQTLRSLSAEAQSRSIEIERGTHQIARAARAQTIARQPASARIRKLMARL